MAGDSGGESPPRRPSLRVVDGGEGESAADNYNPADEAETFEVLVDAVVRPSVPQQVSAVAPLAPPRRTKKRPRRFTRSLKTGKNRKSPVPTEDVAPVTPTAGAESEVVGNGPDTSNWTVAQLKRRIRADHHLKEKYKQKSQSLEKCLAEMEKKHEVKVNSIRSLGEQMRKDKKAVNDVSVVPLFNVTSLHCQL